MDKSTIIRTTGEVRLRRCTRPTCQAGRPFMSCEGRIMEHWRALTLFPDYAVSNLGRVKRISSGSGTHPGRILKTHIDSRGYCVNAFMKNGTMRSKYTHALVLTTFVGHRVGNFECRHVNGNPLDNRLGNLCWDTRKANRADRTNEARLSSAIRLEIKRLLAAGSNIKTIVNNTGVSPTAVRMIKRGGYWRKDGRKKN